MTSTNILYQPEVFSGPEYTADFLNVSPTNINYTVNLRKGNYDPLHLTDQDTFSKNLQGFTPIYNFYAPQMFYQGRAPIQRTGEDISYREGPRIAMIKDVVSLPYEIYGTSNVEAIKKAIVQYGAVTINYQNSSQDIVYNPTSSKAVHASAIVG